MDIFKAFYVWKVDETKGRKPWEDPTLLGLIVGYLCTVAAKYWGANIPPDVQAGIVAFIGFFFRLISPHVGLRAQTPAEITSVMAATSQPSSIQVVQEGSTAEPFKFPSHTGEN